MHLRSGLRTSALSTVVVRVARRRDPKPRAAKSASTQGKGTKKAKKKVRRAVVKTANLQAIVPAVLPRLVPSASLLDTLAVSPLFDFLLVRDVLRLQTSSRGCLVRLTGRDDVFRNCDFYQFDSYYPERHAISLWKLLRKSQTVPRNIRLRYGSAENEIVYSLLLACKLQMLSSLSLTMVEDTPFLLCNGSRFGRFRQPQYSYESRARELVDLTLPPMPRDDAGASSAADVQTMEQIGLGRYLQTQDPSYQRPDMSGFCLVTHLAVAAASLTRLTISMCVGMDITALGRLQLLSYLEVSLSAVVSEGRFFSSCYCVIATLCAVTTLPRLTTFVLRDLSIRDSDRYGAENMKDLVLKSDSLRVADFSRCEKSMALCDVQCPRLEKLLCCTYNGTFFEWKDITSYGGEVYIRETESSSLVSLRSLNAEHGEDVVEDESYGLDAYGTVHFGMYSDFQSELGPDGKERVRDIKVVVPVRLPPDCLFVEGRDSFCSINHVGLPVDHPGIPLRVIKMQTEPWARPHRQRDNMAGVYV